MTVLAIGFVLSIFVILGEYVSPWLVWLGPISIVAFYVYGGILLYRMTPEERDKFEQDCRRDKIRKYVRKAKIVDPSKKTELYHDLLKYNGIPEDPDDETTFDERW